MFYQLRVFNYLQIVLLCCVCCISPVVSVDHRHVHWSPVHVQNVLDYLGINATTFAPEQVYCPSGSLNDTYKQNTIFIGILGFLDLFLLTLSEDNLVAVKNQSHNSCLNDSCLNDSCLTGVPGYYPPVPGEPCKTCTIAAWCLQHCIFANRLCCAVLLTMHAHNACTYTCI